MTLWIAGTMFTCGVLMAMEHEVEPEDKPLIKWWIYPLLLAIWPFIIGALVAKTALLYIAEEK